MDDAEIRKHIEDLVAEEHRLWEHESQGGATGEDRRQLDAIKVTLDQYWDLLRQRRAREEFKLDPETATERDPSVVENYWQ